MALSKRVPVVDVGELVAGGPPAPGSEAIDSIGVACREWGFFQVTRHGIPPTLIASVWEQAHEFFALPSGIKREVMRTHDNPRGYYDRELTKNTRDLKEVFDFGFKPYPELSDSAPPNWTLDGHNQWPRSLPEFQAVLTAYYAACERLALHLTEAICVGLSVPASQLEQSLVGAHTSFARLNFYPPYDPLERSDSAPPSAPGEFGVHHHSDAGILTVLLQDETPGLQVFRDDDWYLVEPLEGALVVNIGDMMQVFSNDAYKAPLHRVLGSGSKARYSVPFFYNPAYETDCYPLETMVDASKAPRYRRVNWGEFRQRRAEGDYADYGAEIQIADYRIA